MLKHKYMVNNIHRIRVLRIRYISALVIFGNYREDQDDTALSLLPLEEFRVDVADEPLQKQKFKITWEPAVPERK